MVGRYYNMQTISVKYRDNFHEVDRDDDIIQNRKRKFEHFSPQKEFPDPEKQGTEMLSPLQLTSTPPSNPVVEQLKQSELQKKKKYWNSLEEILIFRPNQGCVLTVINCCTNLRCNTVTTCKGYI